MIKYTLVILSILFLPAVSSAEVLFSEIAWMGTVDDANNEWIEIYNFSSESTDLTGWTLSDGNSLNIQLSGVMPPHGVFVLERTDDSTLPDIPADIIYTGALSNSGATLTFKDAGGNSMGTPLVGGENWVNIGGNNENKYTPQMTRTGQWVTGTPTPGMPNIEADTDTPPDNNDDNDTLTPPKKTKTSGGSSSAKKQSVPEAPQALALDISAPKIAYVNQEVTFTPVPSGAGKTTRNSLKYLWNFGDLITSKNKEPKHIFEYPGDYVVVVEAEFAKQLAQTRHEIRVLPVALRITETPEGNAMVVNESSHEVNLEGFIFKGILSFTFPRLSILKAGGTVIIPKEKFGSLSKSLALYDKQKTLVTSNILTQANTPPSVTHTAPAVTMTYTKPTPTPTVSKTDITKNTEEPIEETKTQVIQIGEGSLPEAKPGFITRFFKKLGSIFRL